MRGKDTGRKLIAPAVIIVLTALAVQTGVLFLLAMLLLLPVIAALLEYRCGPISAACVCVAMGVAAGLALPGNALPGAFTWCAGCLAASCVPVRKPIYRPILWGAVCLTTWCVLLSTVMRLTGGQTVDGLARGICDLIDGHPERDTILVNAFNAGLCRVNEASAAVPAVSLMGRVTLDESVRLQMLYSLRVTLELSLPTLMCDIVIYHTALTTLLCTLLPDWQRRKRGETGVFPPLEQWYMPKRLGRAVFALLIGWLIAFLSSDGLMLYLGTLCSDVFRAAFLLQGICFLHWLGKRVGMRPTMRNVWSAVLTLLVPIIPIIMGMFDQRRDARHLRPNKEAGQE